MRHLALTRLCGSRTPLRPTLSPFSPRGGVFAALCPFGAKQTKLRSFDAFKKPSPKLAQASKRETLYLCCSRSCLSESQLHRRWLSGRLSFTRNALYALPFAALASRKSLTAPYCARNILRAFPLPFCFLVAQKIPCGHLVSRGTPHARRVFCILTLLRAKRIPFGAPFRAEQGGCTRRKGAPEDGAFRRWNPCS